MHTEKPQCEQSGQAVQQQKQGPSLQTLSLSFSGLSDARGFHEVTRRTHGQRNLVGAQLVSNDELYQASTITCGVQFDGNYTIFALMSAHAFEESDDLIPDYSGLESDHASNYGTSGIVGEYD